MKTCTDIFRHEIEWTPFPFAQNAWNENLFRYVYLEDSVELEGMKIYASFFFGGCFLPSPLFTAENQWSQHQIGWVLLIHWLSNLISNCGQFYGNCTLFASSQAHTVRKFTNISIQSFPVSRFETHLLTIYFPPMPTFVVFWCDQSFHVYMRITMWHNQTICTSYATQNSNVWNPK